MALATCLNVPIGWHDGAEYNQFFSSASDSTETNRPFCVPSQDVAMVPLVNNILNRLFKQYVLDQKNYALHTVNSNMPPA